MQDRIRDAVHTRRQNSEASRDASLSTTDSKRNVDGSGAERSAVRHGQRRRESASSGSRASQDSTHRTARDASSARAASSQQATRRSASTERLERRRREAAASKGKTTTVWQGILSHRWLLVAAGVAVAGTVAVMASTGIAQHLEKQQQMKSVLSAAIEEVRDTDEAIIAFDEQVLMSADNRSEDDVQAAIQEVESIAPLLDSAYEQAQIASEKLVRAGQRETARQTMLDIEARRQMIEHGSRLLEESAYEKDAVDKMEQVWQLILQGDELSSQAADLVTDTTESNVNASMEKSNQAIEAFESALDLVEQVQDEYPKADVSDYYIYIEKRIEGQKAAVECDAYILLKDSESASESSKRLYEYDVQAAKVSERFPDDVTQVITEAQGAQIADLREKYTQARAQVASCDAHLREYLGESNK